MNNLTLEQAISNIILDMDAYDGGFGHSSALIATQEIMQEIVKRIVGDE